MVEGGDVVVELLGHVQHGGHLVGAVAVHLHPDPAVQHFGEGLKLQVAAGAGPLLVFSQFFHCAS